MIDANEVQTPKTPTQELTDRLAERGPDAIAEELVKVGEAARALLNSRLNFDTLITLIQLNTPGRPSRLLIENVLKAAAKIDKVCLKPPPYVPPK